MDAYCGEIRLFPYNRIPPGWFECNGQLLPINVHQILFSLLGKKFGGDGVQTFAVPDFRGRTMVGMGTVATASRIVAAGETLTVGQTGGAEGVVLTAAEMPVHTHDVRAEPTNSGSGTTPNTLRNTVPSTSTKPASAAASAPAAPPIYAVPTLTSIQPLVSDSVMASGGGGAHDNRQPFMPFVFCVCEIGGEYPDRS